MGHGYWEVAEGFWGVERDDPAVAVYHDLAELLSSLRVELDSADVFGFMSSNMSVESPIVDRAELLLVSISSTMLHGKSICNCHQGNQYRYRSRGPRIATFSTTTIFTFFPVSYICAV